LRGLDSQKQEKEQTLQPGGAIEDANFKPRFGIFNFYNTIALFHSSIPEMEGVTESELWWKKPGRSVSALCLFMK
jgi:hypothetical protein